MGGSDAVQDVAPALRNRIGTSIGGRYRVIALLGEGGMGAVYLVEHIQIRKRMALKVLNPELMQNHEMVTRFEREALTTAHLEHPHIVSATDLGRTEDGALFLVMEYVDGKNLREVLELGPLAPPRVLHIARQITLALVRSHAARLVHRDLKPENIMLLSRDGDSDVVKVLDFGLAKVRVDALMSVGASSMSTEALTRHGTVFGTPTYMAPEQGVGGDVDGRTDLYSLGIIMYELLAGCPPFPGDDSAELLRQHVIGKVPPLSARTPALQVPAALEQLVMQLLEKRPEKRPSAASEVLQRIEQISASEGLRCDASQQSPDTAMANLDTPLAQALVALAPAHPEPATTPSELPLAAALADGPSAPPLRAPSIVDLTHLKPDTANSAVLAAAPAPSAGERIHDGAKEAIRMVREVVWPVVKRGGQRAWSAAHTHGSQAWSRMLDFIQPRLPLPLRGVSRSILGFAVGVTLALPVLLILVLVWPSSAPPGTTTIINVPQVGYASDREMERSVGQSPGALAELVVKYPKDARCHRALVRAHAAKKNYVGALQAMVPLLQLDPSAQSDEAMGQVLAEAALVPEITDSAIAFLETAMGPSGVDVLLDLADKTTSEPWRTKFNQSLTKDAVRKLASPEALLLLDLRVAGRCDQKKALLPRATQHGGTRVQRYLRGLQTPTGCGPGGQSDCWPCLRRGSALQNAITAIDQRGGTPG